MAYRVLSKVAQVSFEGFGVLEQRLRRPVGSVLLGILTGVGILVQVVFSLKIDTAIANRIGPPFFLSDISLLFDFAFILTLAIFPIAYCSIFSLTLLPKRIISPLNIQIGTFAVNLIIILDLSLRIFSVKPSDSGQLVGTFVFYGFAAAFFQGIVGFYQTIFVRWFVGLNLGELVAQTYTVSANFGTVRELLLSKAMQEIWNFDPLLKTKHILVLKQSRILVAVQPHGNGSLLSVVSFDEGLYGLESSPSSANYAQTMLNDLSRRLPNSPPLNKPTVRAQADVLALEGIARMYASKCGQSQVAVTRQIWRSLPRYLRYAISATGIAYAIVSGIFFLQHQLRVSIEFGSYLDLSGYFFLVFVGELGLAGWQEIRRRRKDEEESE